MIVRNIWGAFFVCVWVIFVHSMRLNPTNSQTPMVRPKKPTTSSAGKRTDGKTDVRKDGRTDNAISIPPFQLRWRGIMKTPKQQTKANKKQYKQIRRIHIPRLSEMEAT